MKDLLELVPFLNGYPTWVRAVVLGMPPVYAFVVVILTVFAATPVVAIETLRRVALGKNELIALDVTVRNPTGVLATIAAAELELYAGVKPRGGLLSVTTVSATYSVEKTEQAVIVRSDQDKLPFEATVTRPYTGNSYERLTLPLAQQIDAGKADRFIILLKGAGIVLPQHETVELKLKYNGKEITAPIAMKIK